MEYKIEAVVTWDGYIRYEVYFEGRIWGDFNTELEAEEFLSNCIKYKDEPAYTGDKD